MEIIKHTAGHYTINGWEVRKGFTYWTATSPNGTEIRQYFLADLKRQIKESA
jgi:hypothetical protein